jgi:hypothetical protein
LAGCLNFIEIFPLSYFKVKYHYLLLSMFFCTQENANCQENQRTLHGVISKANIGHHLHFHDF